jgi:hypothetical protein
MLIDKIEQQLERTGYKTVHIKGRALVGEGQMKKVKDGEYR